MYCIALIFFGTHGGGSKGTIVAQYEPIVPVSPPASFPFTCADLHQWVIASDATYVFTIGALKVSLGLFFLRIITKKWQRHFVYYVVGFSSFMSVFFFFNVIFQCGNPANYFWNVIYQKCAPVAVQRAMSFLHGAITCATDWCLSILPIAILWNAQMNRRQKLSVGFILSLGMAGSICSAIRFKYLWGLTDISDWFWNATNCSIWSCIEPGTGIIAGNLATMRPLFTRFLNAAQSITKSGISSARQASKQWTPKNSKNSSSATESTNEMGDRSLQGTTGTGTKTIISGGKHAAIDMHELFFTRGEQRADSETSSQHRLSTLAQDGTMLESDSSDNEHDRIRAAAHPDRPREDV